MFLYSMPRCRRIRAMFFLNLLLIMMPMMAPITHPPIALNSSAGSSSWSRRHTMVISRGTARHIRMVLHRARLLKNVLQN